MPAPDFSQCRLDDYVSPERVLPLETARGCTWNRCAFCSHNSGPHPGYQAWSPERVGEILGHLRERYGCRQFALHDLEVPPGRARKLSEAILAAGLDDLSLSGLGRLSRGYRDRRLLGLMRRAGFTSMEWGLESGVQRILDLMRKGTDVATMEDVLERAAEAGIANQCFVLFGFPGETEQEARATLDFMERHPAHVARVIFDVLSVHADSPLGREPESWGVRREDDGSYSIAGGMSRAQLDAISRRVLHRAPVGAGPLQRRRAGAQHGLGQREPRPASHAALVTSCCLATKLWRASRPAATTSSISSCSVSSKAAPTERLWRPVRAAETPLMNARARPPRGPSVRSRPQTVTLADGRRSVSEIRGAVGSAGAVWLKVSCARPSGTAWPWRSRARGRSLGAAVY